MRMADYKWPGPLTPYAHQRATAEFIVEHRRCFVFNDMGTGKTASALWAIDYLMQQREVRRVLIVAPLSTLNRVWLDEAFKLLTHRRLVLLHGAAKERKQKYLSDWEIGIINFDGVQILADQIAADKKLDMVVIDEASAYRNITTRRYKTMLRLTKDMPRLVLMTGTPCPEAPTDAYGLARLLHVENLPVTFGRWRDMTMRQVSQFKWVPKPDGFKAAFQILQPAIRFRKEDCIDLPPVVFETLEVDLSAEQRQAYQAMRKRMALEFDDETTITAVHAADKINKLRQIACGVVRDPVSEEYIVLDYRPRLEALLEVIAESSTKVIVVVPFKGIVYDLADKIARGYSCEVINGDVSLAKRNDIINRFRNTSDPHVLLVHPKVMAHGLTLTEAATMVFYAPIFSNEETKQIIERINRPGQKNKMLIVRMYGCSLEQKIYQKTAAKAINENDLLELFKQEILEQTA